MNTDYTNLLSQKRQELAVLNSRIEANKRRITELVSALGIQPGDELTPALASLKEKLETKMAQLDTELQGLLSKLPEDGAVEQDF